VIRSALVVALGGSAWTQTARAADATPPSAPTAATPSSSSATPSMLRRKGLVATASLGAGIFGSESGDNDKRRYVGTTLSLGLEFGGRVGRNFGFGVAYLRDQAYGLGVSDTQPTTQLPSVRHLSFDLNLYALFADVVLPFAGPELHLQGFFGYSTLGVSGRSNADGISTPDGVGFGCALSGQVPLAGAAMIGLTARYVYAPLSVNETGTGTNVFVKVPALLLTVGFD